MTSLLPTGPTPAVSDLSRLSILLYGVPKVGKSTLASHAPGALFLATEPGLNHLSVHQVPITSWEQLLAVCGELAAGGHDFRTVVIDIIDNAYDMCMAYIAAKNNVKHVGDMDHGKGWALLKGEFKRVLLKLAGLPVGLILVSHEKTVEVKTRTAKFNRTETTLSGQAASIVQPLVDVIMYASQSVTRNADGEPVITRTLHAGPHPAHIAGDRTGRLPATLPMDWAALAAAFGGDSE